MYEEYARSTISQKYIGVTSTNVNKRLYENRNDILQNNTSNPLVVHRNKTDHKFDINDSTLIKVEKNSLRRKYL